MPSSAISILDRVLVPWAAGLTRHSAEQVLQFQLDAEFQQRIDALADKAADGSLTESERSEYEELIDSLDLLGIFKAKAREALSRRAGP